MKMEQSLSKNQMEDGTHMLNKTKYSQFSKMEWLDGLVSKNRNGPGRNEVSDFYYKVLLEIREAQFSGTILDELYIKAGLFSGSATPEEGYYLANIHYDIYSDFENVESIENRIIYFLEASDEETLKKKFDLKNNLIHDLRFLLEKKYDILDPTIKDNFDFIKKYADKTELVILKNVLSILLK